MVNDLDNKEYYIPWKEGFGSLKPNRISIMFVDVFFRVTKDIHASDDMIYSIADVNVVSLKTFSRYALTGKEIKDIVNVS